MKRIMYFILGIALITSFKYVKAQTTDVNQHQAIVLSGYKMVNILKDKKGVALGKVYIKEIKNGVFKHLRILNGKKVIDTLYYIDNLKLKNSKGPDIQVGDDEFDGYKIVLAKNDYIVITVVNKKGNGISDNISINWNNKSKLFEVLKTP